MIAKHKKKKNTSDAEHHNLRPKSKWLEVLFILTQNCGTVFFETVLCGLLGNSDTVSMQEISWKRDTAGTPTFFIVHWSTKLLEGSTGWNLFHM